MPDRVKTIKGLGDTLLLLANHVPERYLGYAPGACLDAIELLKAQDPRVMTPEEVNALDWDYCYLEQERMPGKEYRGLLGKHIMTCVTWPSITAAKLSYGIDKYGVTWRCWTSRPTDEQRRETPWE